LTTGPLISAGLPAFNKTKNLYYLAIEEYVTLSWWDLLARSGRFSQGALARARNPFSFSCVKLSVRGVKNAPESSRVPYGRADDAW